MNKTITLDNYIYPIKLEQLVNRILKNSKEEISFRILLVQNMIHFH